MSIVALFCLAIGMLPSSSSARAPVPNDPKAEAQQKAVKEFAGTVVKAIAKQHIDGLVDMSEVPWCRDGGTFSNTKKELRKDLENMLEGKPVFDAKYSIKSAETFKSARSTLDEEDVKRYKDVLSDEDCVVHAEVDYPNQKVQVRLLIKMKDGKPRLVGFGGETR